MFDEAGHFPHHTDPDRFVRVLREFMERSTPARYDPRGGGRVCSSGDAKPGAGPAARPAPSTCREPVPWRLRVPPVGNVPLVEHAGDEEVLHGGVANQGQVVRVGPHVLRPSNPHSLSIFAFLRGADRRLRRRAAAGGDRRRRTRAARVRRGRAPAAPYPSWALTDEALTSVAELMARLHRASAAFDPARPGVTLERGDRRPPGRPRSCVTTTSASRTSCSATAVAVALLDFDFCAPAARSTTWRSSPGCACRSTTTRARPCSAGTVRTARARLRQVCDAYGLDRPGRNELLEILDGAMARSGEFVKRMRMPASRASS